MSTVGDAADWLVKRISALVRTADSTDLTDGEYMAVDKSDGYTRKITVANLAMWVLGRIKSLSTTITAFRTGDVIPVDGPDGTAKMSKESLLYIMAEISVTKLNEYVHQFVSPNIFDKTKTIVGCQMGTTISNYTDYTSRSLTPAIEIPITNSPKIYFNKFVGVVGFFDVYGNRQGAFASNQFMSTTHGYATPDWTTGHNIKYVQIQFSNVVGNANYADPNELIVSLSEVGEDYVPFANYPLIKNEQVRMAKDMQLIQGLYSTFVGSECGNKNVESFENDNGRYNTAMGVRAMKENTTGDHGTAFGYQALQKNTMGNYNTAIGEDALFNNTTGSTNTAVGIRPMQNNTTGEKNVAVGGASLYNNTSGSMNVCIGTDAGKGIVDKDGNICIGYNADVENGHSNTIVIGRSQKATKSGQVVIGHKNYTIETLLFGDVIIHGTDGVDRKLVFNNDGTISWVDVTPTP